MKKRMFVSAIVLFIAYKTPAQVMAAKPEWITIKSANLRCWECKERLEKYMMVENKTNMQSGIRQYKFNLLEGEVKVQYLADRVSPEEIRIAFNNAGFDADDEKAEETVYKKLPPICKRPEEGGGPSKGKPCHLPPQE